MITRALISFAIPALSGFFLVDALFKKQAEDFFWALFKICLAVGPDLGCPLRFSLSGWRLWDPPAQSSSRSRY